MRTHSPAYPHPRTHVGNRVHEMSEHTKSAFVLQTTAPKYADDENDCFDGLMSDNDGDSASLGGTEGDEEDEYVLI